ncbi:MAG: hypothetical protein PWP49_315 [Thermococcaceae archaeon]|jgi:hypothetical protein|uniref:hypothetical protein n=1 Tax=Thermococcus TaxID=2263 RepID=UPI001CED416F|nr:MULTISPECIES: hypothetical protein [Thermococcus]MDN5319895.1 hypothetical protein [Thermococcaceae archaeon]
MSMFFKPSDAPKNAIELLEELTPLVGGLENSSIAGVITTDALAQNLIQYSSIANALNSEIPTYYLEPTNGFSTKLLSKFSEKSENILMGKVYTLGELLDALGMVRDDSFVFVSNFGVLEEIDKKGMLELRKIVDRKGIFLVLSHNALEINELNLISEFRRLFFVPELFEYLLVMRVSGYRGHYRLNLTVLKAPSEFVKNTGEHSIPIDSKVKMILE